MPWTDLGSVPPSVAKHKKVKLTLAQANFWASIYDGVKKNPEADNPAAIAWAQFEKRYAIKGERWALRQKPSTKDEDRYDNITWEMEADSILAACPYCKDENTEEGIMVMDIVVDDTLNASAAKAIQSFKCDEYACYLKKEKEKEVAYVHFRAVTTNVSNKQRFPEKVLARDINTLEDKPVVDWHSDWPNGNLSNFDIIGRVMKAWYNKPKKWAEVVVKFWDTKIVRIIKERKKNGKPLITHVSVGYLHRYHKEGNIKVTDKVKFHHLGFLPKSDAADKGAGILPMDESLLDGISLKAVDNSEFEVKWVSEMKEFVKQKDSKMVILSKTAIADLLKEYPPKKGEIAWLIMRKSTYHEGWDWDDTIVSEDEPSDAILSEMLSTGDYRMFKVGKDITEAGFNYARITDLPKGHRNFTIGKTIKSMSSKNGAGSSTLEAKEMEDELAKKAIEKAEAEVAAKEKELETKAAELAKQAEETKALQEKLATLEADAKANSEALEKASKYKEDNEALLQQKKEEELAAQVEALVKKGTIAKAKSEETLALLKGMDEQGQKSFLAVLETKAADVPHGKEDGKGEDGTDPEDGVELMSDKKAEAIAQEVHGCSYEELVKGKLAVTTGETK